MTFEKRINQLRRAASSLLFCTANVALKFAKADPTRNMLGTVANIRPWEP